MNKIDSLCHHAGKITRSLRVISFLFCAVIFSGYPLAAQEYRAEHSPPPVDDSHENLRTLRRLPKAPGASKHHQHGEYTSENNKLARFIPTYLPKPFGVSLTKHWFEKWPDSHFSRRGVPFTHLFNLEPATLDRDFFLDTKFVRGESGNEVEIGTELEWALTRRIGFVLEAPLTFLDPDVGVRETGVGDVSIAPRLLMVDTRRFLLAFNFKVDFPTGSQRRGLGAGEVAISPTISTWFDLGHWFAFSTQFGTRFGVESGDKELLYNAAITWAFLGHALVKKKPKPHEGEPHELHFPPGQVNLVSEYTGTTSIDGASDGQSLGLVTVGAGYLITSGLEVRGGVQFPVTERREFDRGYIFSLVRHF